MATELVKAGQKRQFLIWIFHGIQNERLVGHCERSGKNTKTKPQRYSPLLSDFTVRFVSAIRKRNVLLLKP